MVIPPNIDPHKLSIGEKIKLVRESDGLLIELLENEIVKGNLYLGGCASLVSLPNGLKVRGYLDLTHCTSLVSLPNGLKVRGYLNLYDCTSLFDTDDRIAVQLSLINKTQFLLAINFFIAMLFSIFSFFHTHAGSMVI